jgi:hypothetical protein
VPRLGRATDPSRQLIPSSLSRIRCAHSATHAETRASDAALRCSVAYDLTRLQPSISDTAELTEVVTETLQPQLVAITRERFPR